MRRSCTHTRVPSAVRRTSHSMASAPCSTALQVGGQGVLGLLVVGASMRHDLDGVGPTALSSRTARRRRSSADVRYSPHARRDAGRRPPRPRRHPHRLGPRHPQLPALRARRDGRRAPRRRDHAHLPRAAARGHLPASTSDVGRRRRPRDRPVPRALPRRRALRERRLPRHPGAPRRPRRRRTARSPSPRRSRPTRPRGSSSTSASPATSPSSAAPTSRACGTTRRPSSRTPWTSCAPARTAVDGPMRRHGRRPRARRARRPRARHRHDRGAVGLRRRRGAARCRVPSPLVESPGGPRRGASHVG